MRADVTQWFHFEQVGAEGFVGVSRDGSGLSFHLGHLPGPVVRVLIGPGGEPTVVVRPGVCVEVEGGPAASPAGGGVVAPSGAATRAADGLACGARNRVKAFLRLVQPDLTFTAVVGLLHQLLVLRSGDVVARFVVAALLYARAKQRGSRCLRVLVKRETARDRRGRSAADVQVRTGTRVDEAYQVTGGDWAAKLPGAGDTARTHDLARLHILARVDDVGGMLTRLKAEAHDISAVDLRAFVSVLTAELRREYRAHALRRLYELLDRVQGDVDLVNGYVDLLVRTGLATAPTAGGS